MEGLDSRHLLPRNIRPVHYNLQFIPDLKAFTFDGFASIAIDVLEDSTKIIFHTLELDLESVEVVPDQPDGSKHIPKDIVYNEDEQMQTLSFHSPIPKGKAHLNINFKGQINDKGTGFYRSSYIAEDGTKGYMFCTLLAPTMARRVFPCFDEPDLKASFSITFTLDEELVCLSNMNIVSQEFAGNSRKTIQFADTPPMSTYLAAFVIGDFHYVETDTFHVPLKVYMLPGKEASGKYPVELAAKTMAFFEEQFGVEYPLPKLDLVGVTDFGGAMENWGLVIGGEREILFDEKAGSSNDKIVVAEIVQHELAHMWFGDLVTNRTWDGIWLNEAFATWMSWYSCDHFYPEWHVWRMCLTKNLEKALQLDSLRSSHPIEVKVEKPSEIYQIFDAISYEKGSCVIRMIAEYLGEEVFMNGIRLYMNKHAYGNTKTSDLWDALSEVSGHNVSKLMDPWVKKIGYPIISVTETSRGINIKQNRYLQTADATDEEDETIYPVFLGLSTAGSTKDNILMDKRFMEIPLDTTQLFKLNTGHSGFFRVLYTPERLLILSQAMSTGQLGVEDRIGLIADAGALAASGHHHTSALLGLLADQRNETDGMVWNGIILQMNRLEKAWMFQPKEVRLALRQVKKDLFSTRARSIGWTFSPDDNVMRQQHKVAMFKAAGIAGDEEIQNAALDMFRAQYHSSNPIPIHANLRRAVYAIVLSTHGAQEDFDALLKVYSTSPSHDEREDAVRGMGSFRKPKVVQNLLDLTLTDSIKAQEITMPLVDLGEDPDTTIQLWKWTKSHFSQLEAKASVGFSTIQQVTGIVTRNLATTEQLHDLQQFFEGKNTAAYNKTLAQSIDGIKAKAAWVERDAEDVRSWLVEKGYLPRY